MIQCRRHASFAPESFEGLRILGEIVRQKLQGDEATKFGVLGFVDNSMPPPPSFSTMR